MSNDKQIIQKNIIGENLNITKNSDDLVIPKDAIPFKNNYFFLGQNVVNGIYNITDVEDYLNIINILNKSENTYITSIELYNTITDTTISSNSYVFYNVFNNGSELVNTQKTIIKSDILIGNIASVVGTPQKQYVPITITNAQSTDTPINFQQIITINSSDYTSYESSDLSNIFFTTDTTASNLLTSWLESGNSNSATASVYWILLPNGIPANSSLTIYMQLDDLTNNDFNTDTTGIAPQLSSTYAEYDNGASVFNFYDNFKGTILSNKWTSNVTSGATLNVNNGISLNSGVNPNESYISFANSVFPSNIIIESLINIYGTTNTDARSQIFVNGNSNISIATQLGMYGNSAAPEYYDGGWTGVNVPIGSSATDYNIIDQWIFPSSGTLVWNSCNNNNGSKGSLINTESSTFTIANFETFYNAWNEGLVSTLSVINIQWTRIRAYPPSGVMPSVSINSLVIISAQSSVKGIYQPIGKMGIAYSGLSFKINEISENHPLIVKKSCEFEIRGSLFWEFQSSYATTDTITGQLFISIGGYSSKN